MFCQNTFMRFFVVSDILGVIWITFELTQYWKYPKSTLWCSNSEIWCNNGCMMSHIVCERHQIAGLGEPHSRRSRGGPLGLMPVPIQMLIFGKSTGYFFVPTPYCYLHRKIMLQPRAHRKIVDSHWVHVVLWICTLEISTVATIVQSRQSHFQLI